MTSFQNSLNPRGFPRTTDGRSPTHSRGSRDETLESSHTSFTTRKNIKAKTTSIYSVVLYLNSVFPVPRQSNIWSLLSSKQSYVIIQNNTGCVLYDFT